MTRRILALLAGLALTGGLACSVTVKPVVAPDPQIACPGGSAEWRLEIVDQRADRNHAKNVEATIRDSLVRSLPGCRWVTGNAPAITIEVHRFSVRQDDNWEAAVEWSVLARDRQGRTLTEFQADSQVSRPNYRNVDNEKAALQQALDEAMRRTLAGLRSVSSSG
jgi:uncharacterized lipoprotein YmbA